MKIVAVIPIKMNNVRTPGKNTKPLSDGTPLIHLIQKTLLKVSEVDDIYVYCSNEEIKDFILPGVKYVKRDPVFDTPEADVLEMMRVFSEIVDADIYVQIHATSPLISEGSVSEGIKRMESGEYDSAFAVTKLQDFLWQDGKPFNYSLDNIPRTQDMKPFWKETTGMYMYNKNVIQKLHRRIGDKPYMIPLSEIESLDVDTPEDFTILDAVYTFLTGK